MSNWTFPRADVVRVVDGDTVDLDIIYDIGFNDVITRRRSFRLLGINALESKDPGGAESTENLRKLLPVGTSLRLESVKDDKFGGRFDAILWLGDINISQKLIDTGWAVKWNGNGKKPMPVWPRVTP